MHNLNFPIIIIKQGEPGIYVSSEKDFGLVSKSLRDFYYSGIIYDSTGNKFNIKGVNKVISASFWESLKNLQPMEKIEVDVDFIQEIDLTEFRTVLIEQVKKYPDYWELKDLLPDLIQTINSLDGFKQIITYIA